MIIKISDSWLREYLDTEATPEEIKEFLSLSGPTVEALEKLPDDTIYTIEVTPNRNDLLSVFGIAREAKAILSRYGKKAELKDIKAIDDLPKKRETPNVLPLNAEIKDASLCPHFLAVVLNNIKINTAPKFMRERLERSGFRAINNVVDISNYIMLETGQPLHIFDYDKIESNLMRLRESRVGEELSTLDGIKRKIPEGSIIIEDREKIIDLCGIMGGENSSTSDTTTSVVLFAQIYNPNKVRKTYRSLNLITEAALRFEKGIDPEMVSVAFNKALELLKKHAQARIAGEPIEIISQQSEDQGGKFVTVSISEVQDYLGERISTEKASEYLRALGFEVTVTEDSFEPPKIKVKVPSFRITDITIPEDLIEEIARLHGYHNLPEVLPTGSIPEDIRDKSFHWETLTKNVLKFSSFFEVYNYSFISAELLKKARMSPNEAIKLKNPLNIDLELLRTSLLPSILNNIHNNRKYAEDLRLFELERVYLKGNQTSKSDSQELPKEIFHLSALTYNPAAKRDQTERFNTLKGILEAVFLELGIQEYKPNHEQGYKFEHLSQDDADSSLDPDLLLTKNFWHPGRTAVITINDPRLDTKTLGILGEINPQIMEQFGLTGKGAAFDIKTDLLFKLATSIKPYRPIIGYPAIIEDISLIVDKKIPTTEIRNGLWSAILSYKEVDLRYSTVTTSDAPYEDDAFGKNKKSVTFNIHYQGKIPLTNENIKKVREHLYKELKERFSAIIRQAEI